MFSSLYEREMELVIQNNELVILTNRPELGLFTYGGVGIRFDKTENTFVFEHEIRPREELFFGGIQGDYVLVELSAIESVESRIR